ncbi:hypothetical protein C4544_04600 [candidate division WS5 bacterium]|uniref:Uncharacterized protein n=1 Tax=candidate division WS5 bacterium TaxID=2093353 RepID=A0A419DCB2_9BACT|nr:MAG: hypothetical protein C4544_04600 [candidate division WS5 bacterium]
MTPTVKKVEEVVINLTNLAQEEQIPVVELVRIWAALPTEDTEGMTYLEVAGQCILEVSNMVNKNFPNLSVVDKTARKYRLMGKLLVIKADQVLIR